jgi:hypothetical protein
LRRIVLATCLVLTASCGGNALTLTEYAEQVEGLTTTMYGKLGDLGAELASEAPTVEGYQAFFNGQTAAYQELLDGLQVIEPPKGYAELHAVSVGIMTRLTIAQETLSRRADDIETMDELSLLPDTPELLAADAARYEIIEFCQAMQAHFDATAARDAFVDVPWIPSELQEVVVIAFACETEGGGGS